MFVRFRRCRHGAPELLDTELKIWPILCKVHELPNHVQVEACSLTPEGFVSQLRGLLILLDHRSPDRFGLLEAQTLHELYNQAFTT